MESDAAKSATMVQQLNACRCLSRVARGDNEAPTATVTGTIESTV